MSVAVHSLVAADQIYQDIQSGKFILSGTFHSIRVPELPCTLPYQLNVYTALSGVTSKTKLEYRIVYSHAPEKVQSFDIEIAPPAQGTFTDFHVGLSPVTLLDSGKMELQLCDAYNQVLGNTYFIIESGSIQPAQGLKKILSDSI